MTFKAFQKFNPNFPLRYLFLKQELKVQHNFLFFFFFFHLAGICSMNMKIQYNFMGTEFLSQIANYSLRYYKY